MEVILSKNIKSYVFLYLAYEGFLEYNAIVVLPTEASVECDWADGAAVFKDNLDEMAFTNESGLLRYKITHSYKEHGEYNMTCK
jgi:hypothetical protein